MSERCPICDKDECQHTDDEKELVKLRAEVSVLDGAIEGWRSHSERLERELKEERFARHEAAMHLLKKQSELHAELGSWKAEAERLMVEREALSKDYYCLREISQRRGIEVKHLREVLESILDRRRLRDVSMLVSNPPQNSAVHEIQVIARAALGEGGK